MNVVALCGRLSSQPVVRELQSGAVVMGLELTTKVDDASISVPLAWFDPPAGIELGAGDEITGEKYEHPRRSGGVRFDKFGGDLLSQGVYPQVPLALAVLTSVFGMGTGVTLPLWPPKSCVNASQSDLKDSRANTSDISDQSSPRPISTGQLNTLPCLHFRPINVMVLSRALLR